MFVLPVDGEITRWRTFGDDVNVVMDRENPFAGNHSPKIIDGSTGMASIMQRDWRLQQDQKYVGYIWLKCCDNVESVNIMLDVFIGRAVALFGRISVPVKVGDYYRHDFEFTGPYSAPGQFTITVFRKGDEPATVHVGRVSVMPADNVHGLRAETLELLHRLDPAIYRKHFAKIPAQVEHDHATLDVQAATTDADKALTVAIVNSSDNEEAVKLDVTGFDIAGKTVRQVVFAVPQNEQQQMPMTDTKLETFDGSIVADPSTVTLLLLEEPDNFPLPSQAMLDQVARLKAKGIPLTDYHIHLRGGMTAEKAFDWAQKTGIRSGVLENAGREWPLSDDEKLLAFIEDARRFPELLVGIQVNDRDWYMAIDPAVRAELDFVLGDTMLMDGQRLWFEGEYEIANEDVWLERYFVHTMTVVNEPITILANPMYLPDKIMHRFDDFWTEARMIRLIDAAIHNNVALEIQSDTQFPNKRFMEIALERGAKITIGRNNHDDRPNELKRSLDWLEKLNVKPENMLDLQREPRPAVRPATVRGMVTLNGDPVEGAMVTFHPIDPRGVPVYGRTDANGSSPGRGNEVGFIKTPLATEVVLFGK